MARGKNNKKGNAPRPKKEQTPPYTVLVGKRDPKNIKSDGTHLVKWGPAVSPLAVVTHARWSFVSDEPLSFRPRDGAPRQFVPKYTSGWVPISAWDDVELTALTDAHFHISVDQRGFIQM